MLAYTETVGVELGSYEEAGVGLLCSVAETRGFSKRVRALLSTAESRQCQISQRGLL